MKNILLITPIDRFKKRLDQLIKRRYGIFDYLEIIDLDYLASLEDNEKSKYLSYVIEKRKIDFVIWLPAGSACNNTPDIELLSLCIRCSNIHCVVFEIEKFISIEGQEINVLENEVSTQDKLMKDQCNNIVSVSYLIDSGISILHRQLNLTPYPCDNNNEQIFVSLIDDIAEYVFDYRESLKISNQPYTLNEISQKLKTDFFIVDYKSKEIKSGFESDRLETLVRQKACCLQPIYQLTANDFWHAKRIASARAEMGSKLATHLTAASIDNIDIVIPVPETGKYYAQGLASAIGKPFIEAIVRNQNMGRGLQIEDAAQRNIFIRKKLTVIDDLVKEKNVGIVDEAIFTGATLRIVVDQLKVAGAKRIHILLPTPHNVRVCEYNVLPQRNVLLDYVRHIDLKNYFDVDEITFSTMDDLIDSLGNQMCVECFDC